MDITAIHQPVLLEDCVRLVTSAARRPGAIIVDCTLGLAGHATAFLHNAPEATLIGIDRDEEALGLATRRMKDGGFEGRFIPVHAAFDEFADVLAERHIDKVDAVFMDLGLSSLQIDETERGFSYSHDAPLDMRMDVTQTRTAETILNEYPVERLRRIFREYGEERFSGPIAKAVVEARDRGGLHTSAQLNELVDRVVPKSHRPAGNPAKRVFQALRIEVNGELDKLAATLPQALLRLRPGGRIVVESYHSLEDTIVKRFFATGLVSDVPAGMPVVPDDMRPFLRDLTHGAVKADEAEREANPRSASVRLRAVELARPVPERMRKRYEEMAAGRRAQATGRRDHRGPQGRRRHS